MPVRSIVCLGVSICLFSGALADAEDWPNWRGPGQDQIASPGDYPVSWGDRSNVAWRIALPGKAGSTPIVWGERLILTTPINGENGVLCLDRSGKEIWRQTVGAETPAKHRKGSGTNPSPVTDGERIFVYFKSGDFAGLDFDGKVLWRQNLPEKFGYAGRDTMNWDWGTSPVLTEKYVVFACMQTGPSYLAAFDPKTGELVWKTERDHDAPEESPQSYSTPVVTQFQGEEQLVTVGADCVTCHAAADGRELWRVTGLNPEQLRNYRSIASPAVINGLVLAPYARGNSLTAIRMGGSGNVTDTHVIWRTTFAADVPSPTARDGKAFVIGDRGRVAQVDLQTGEEDWSLELEKHRTAYSSSPVLAGDRMYVVREDAKTFVVDLSSRSVISVNVLGEDEYTLSTPVLVDGRIYLRTFEHLFCIEQPGRAVSQR